MIIRHFHLFIVSPVSNVKTNVVEKITLHSEIERELSKVRVTKSALGVTNTTGGYSLIIWDSSKEDKFVIKTRDQPEPGSSFRLLSLDWGDKRLWGRG